MLIKYELKKLSVDDGIDVYSMLQELPRAETVKLRHYLTETLRNEGGHGGYAVKPSERNKGYGTILLKLLKEEAARLDIDKILLTIRNDNIASIKVALNNEAIIEKKSDERQFLWIRCQ